MRRSALAALALASAGCSSIGPDTIPQDQANYSQRVAQAERQELLRALVSLRYGEAPSILRLRQVVAGYQRETTASTEIFPDDRTETFIGGQAKLIDRPTISYAPVNGGDFYRGVILPVEPSAIFFLISSGWPAETLIPLTVKSINGVRGGFGTMAGGFSPASAEFREIVGLIAALEQADALDVRLDPEGGDARLWLRANGDPQADAITAQLRARLRLDPGTDAFTLTFGRAGEDHGALYVHTRSIAEVMTVLASMIDAPQAHVGAGRTFPDADASAFAPLPPFVIRHADARPDTPFAQTKNRGHWFFIDDADYTTKTTFSILSLLVATAELGGQASGAVLTISTN